jgi:hypothetical protein
VSGRDPLGGGRSARSAAAADPVDVLQPCPQRHAVGGLVVAFRSNPSLAYITAGNVRINLLYS